MQAPKYSSYFHIGAIVSLVVLIAWLMAWEILVAPLKPGGSWLALKAVPLLIPLGGVVRAWSDKLPVSQLMAWGEILLVCIYFACALLYLRPYKKAAKAMAKELLEKVNTSKTK